MLYQYNPVCLTQQILGHDGHSRQKTQPLPRELARLAIFSKAFRATIVELTCHGRSRKQILSRKLPRVIPRCNGAGMFIYIGS